MEEKLSFFNAILASAYGMGWVQWLAFLFSITYVILAVKENIWCWAFGLVGVVLAFKVYIDVQLYSDAVLQIYYAGMSVYGWINWKKESNQMVSSVEILDIGEELEVKEETLAISMWSWQMHLMVIAVGVVLSFLLGYMWTFFGAALPYIDAFTTSFSIIATVMVAKKILENWIYWIIIDFVCIFVYIHREIHLFAILFFIYLIVAVVGYFSWKKQYLAYKTIA